MLTILSFSCKHSPVYDSNDDLIPVDTTTADPGTDPLNGVPCDPDLVYFELEVLPILLSNCALSGCHDGATAQNEVILTSYDKVMETADVEAFRPDNSKIYKIITENDPEDRMPPSPRNALQASQIKLIADWIRQGAENLQCNPETGNCNTIAISFQTFVQPLIQDHCLGCHSGGSPSGGVNLSNHQGVANAAQSGRLYGAIAHLQGYVAMPQGGAKLPDCTIAKIGAWIDAGAPDN